MDINFLSLYTQYTFDMHFITIFLTWAHDYELYGHCVLFAKSEIMALFLHPSKQTFCSIYCYTICRLWFQYCVDFLSWVLYLQDDPLIYCINEQFYFVPNQASVFIVTGIKCIPSKYQYLFTRQHDVNPEDHCMNMSGKPQMPNVII